jgi:3-oxoacyl-[acyl-carrier-protein] synthase II
VTPRRVVITGAGVASPIGHSLAEVSLSLQTGRHGIVTMPEWDQIGDLRTRLGGVVQGLDLERRWNRKQTRTMGRVALLATHATEQALTMAGLLGDEVLSSGRTGLAYGSTSGSSEALADFCTTLFAHMNMRGLQSTSFLRFMAHTCAANLAQFFAVRGRIIPTNSACTSGAQAIGYAYESIKYGMQEVMIAGGADEMHFTTAVTFDLMFATSANFNKEPERSPRPFDTLRDGLVVGEGAATLILESLERARARGATILGEIRGYGTNCDGLHITAPSQTGMRGAMLLGLADAGLDPAAIDYVNAHGTATDIGDIAESAATREVFERAVPISSSKSFTGHTMGACGAIEAVFCLAMLEGGWLAPTRNLENVDPRCAELDYVRELRAAPELRTVMSNNFAFGGVNTSLILGRV